MVAAGVSGEAKGKALCDAAGAGHVSVVSALLVTGLSDEAKGEALRKAAGSWHLSVVSALLAFGVGEEAKGEALIDAVISDVTGEEQLAVVSALLAAGIDQAAKDYALYEAANHGCSAIVSLLLAAGADEEFADSGEPSKATTAEVPETDTCPYYDNEQCRNPNDSRVFDCSWIPDDFLSCATYELITDPVRGRQQIRDSFSRSGGTGAPSWDAAVAAYIGTYEKIAGQPMTPFRQSAAVILLKGRDPEEILRVAAEVERRSAADGPRAVGLFTKFENRSWAPEGPSSET